MRFSFRNLGLIVRLFAAPVALAEPIGDERAVPERLDRAAVETRAISSKDVIRIGRSWFEAKFSQVEGAGRPGATSAIVSEGFSDVDFDTVHPQFSSERGTPALHGDGRTDLAVLRRGENRFLRGRGWPTVALGNAAAESWLPPRMDDVEEAKSG